MLRQLIGLKLDFDILFVDDNSPDGTGQLLEQLAKDVPHMRVLHRAGKLGIGTAHLDGINWAYQQGYSRLVTLDCDFTHLPSDIPRLLREATNADVIVASRYLQEGSLSDWNLVRRALTHFGHFLTRRLLGLPFDATGAFRVYNLKSIPKQVFERVVARGYAFFFESLFLLHQNGLQIREVPIQLPARTYGHSKMSAKEAIRSGVQVLSLSLDAVWNPTQFRVSDDRFEIEINQTLADPQHWEGYWQNKIQASGVVYDLIATAYRNLVIRRRLNSFVRRLFPRGANLLHAGCGSGQVDIELQDEMKITAVDISVPALRLYHLNNPTVHCLRHASILDLPFDSQAFDGVYNLGVMEHFTRTDIVKILREVHRVLKQQGKVVLFWPHSLASSVIVLKLAHWLLNRVLKSQVRLHPAEVSLFSRRAIEPTLNEAGFEISEHYFGIRDLFVQVVLVLQKR